MADGIEVHRAGLTTSMGGEEVCGSAADRLGSAAPRALFELLERVSGLEALGRHETVYVIKTENGESLATCSRADVFPESDAPDRWRYARSNGIALHTDWPSACRRALWELAERDRVLRSWYGEISPQPIALGGSVLAEARSYEWRAAAFPEPQATSFSCGIEVVGVFGFPLREDVPFAFGLAGRPSLDDAIAVAESEALQVLAFLWGEPLPEGPILGEPSPMQHLDTYQVRGACDAVRRWLDDGHRAFAGERGTGTIGRSLGLSGFIDLTPSWLTGDLRVAKAVSQEAVPLIFGDSPYARHLPQHLRLHPIP
jgi:ribosomal protein S12 methylthiotransferase accessory factor YcaO